MSEQTLKFGDVVASKKEFHASKQATALNLVDTDRIVLLDNFIGYLDDDDIIRPLCLISPQMNGYIKYFDDDGKNVS